METLENKFRKYIADNALFTPEDRILLTVSGGVDSMVMLSLFAKSGFHTGVAHCNFQLRGQEADEDEVLVEQEASRFGLPFYNKRFNTREEMERTGESVQMTARKLRYAWFNELCETEGYTTVAIAHHADDSIETFFINLLRGTGLKGLTGIHKVNGRVIRPLLFASRKEILDYALQHKIPYREDSSNRSTKYLRNKIRLGIIPRLREINPHFTKVMSGDIKRLIDAQRFIDRSVELLRDTVVFRRQEDTVIDPSRIDPAMPKNFVIYELMNSGYGFKGDVVDQLCDALHGDNATGKRFYSKDHVATIDRGLIVISGIADSDPCFTEILSGQDKVYCGNSVLYLEQTDIDNVGALNQPENIALIDADKLVYPLQLRRWQEGDTFKPLGMNGHKKVSDYLIDSKVSLAEKDRQFVLLSEGKIVWLVGRRLDDRFKVGETTENILRITKEII